VAENCDHPEKIECHGRADTEAVSLADASLDLCVVIENWHGPECAFCILNDMSQTRLVHMASLACAMVLTVGFDAESYRAWTLEKIASGDERFV
jgi:hypothetical protein